MHPLHRSLPEPFTPARVTRFTLNLNDRAMNPINVATTQFSRCFIPSMIKLWNRLPSDTVHFPTMASFKSQVNAFLR